MLENVGRSEFEAAEVEKMFFKMDRAGVRDLAKVWKPGVPLDQNPDYVNLSRQLNSEMESALMASRRGETTREEDGELGRS